MPGAQQIAEVLPPFVTRPAEPRAAILASIADAG